MVTVPRQAGGKLLAVGVLGSALALPTATGTAVAAAAAAPQADAASGPVQLTADVGPAQASPSVGKVAASPASGPGVSATIRGAYFDGVGGGAAFSTDPTGQHLGYLQLFGGVGVGGVVNVGLGPPASSGLGFGSRLVYGPTTIYAETDLLHNQTSITATGDYMPGLMGPGTGLAGGIMFTGPADGSSLPELASGRVSGWNSLGAEASGFFWVRFPVPIPPGSTPPIDAQTLSQLNDFLNSQQDPTSAYGPVAVYQGIDQNTGKAVYCPLTGSCSTPVPGFDTWVLPAQPPGTAPASWSQEFPPQPTEAPQADAPQPPAAAPQPSGDPAQVILPDGITPWPLPSAPQSPASQSPASQRSGELATEAPVLAQANDPQVTNDGDTQPPSTPAATQPISSATSPDQPPQAQPPQPTDTQPSIVNSALVPNDVPNGDPIGGADTTISS
jgi:hypothetical protein